MTNTTGCLQELLSDATSSESSLTKRILKLLPKLPILLAAFLVQFCTVGPVVSFGVYQAFYTGTWLPSSSPSSISWIGSVQLFLEFAVALFAGRLLDLGYLKSLLISGSLIFGGSAVALAFTSKDAFYQVFLCQGIGMGLGLGLVYMPSIVMISQHFTGRRMLAMGFVSTGGSLGGLVFPIILQRYFAAENGFKYGTLRCAWVIIGCLLLANVVLLVTCSHKTPDCADPILQADPALQTGVHSEKELTDVIQDLTQSPTATNSSYEIKIFVLAVAGSFFASTTCYWPIFYVSLFGESRGISSSNATFAVSALNIASIIGRVIPCWIADRTGVFWVIVPTVFLAGASSIAMLACTNMASLVTFSVIYGILSGAYVSLFFPMIDTLSSRWPGRKGVINGIACAPISVALLIGNPVTGAIVGSEPDFKWVQGSVFCGAFLFIGSALLGVAGWMHRFGKKQ